MRKSKLVLCIQHRSIKHKSVGGIVILEQRILQAIHNVVPMKSQQVYLPFSFHYVELIFSQ